MTEPPRPGWCCGTAPALLVLTFLIESFWGRMHTELLNRRWRTRIELANAIFEYLEITHNRRRRHSSLGKLSPVQYELQAGDPDQIEPVA